jgi:ribosomal protein S18 acetylase RimI-like enzyme
MTTFLTIRPARAGEADAVADLHAVSWRSAYRGILPDETLGPDLVPRRRAFWQQAFTREDWNAILVAEDAGALIGFIAVSSDPDGAYDAFVQSLHVHPERKRGGIGRALLGAAATVIAAAGRRSVYLWVYDGNVPARDFYFALGGTAAEAKSHEIAGQQIPELRMVWPDAAALAARCANGSGR